VILKLTAEKAPAPGTTDLTSDGLVQLSEAGHLESLTTEESITVKDGDPDPPLRVQSAAAGSDSLPPSSSNRRSPRSSIALGLPHPFVARAPDPQLDFDPVLSVA